jgi:hypothetical protein
MIEFRIEGDAAVVRSLAARVPALTKAVLNSVTRASIMLVRYVKENKLSGQVLHVRTGNLRRAVNFRVTQSPTSITGSVGVKSKYGRAHELGLDVEETVREHLRTAKMAFGRPISPVTFSVRAHTRHMKLPERSFLRSSLREMTPQIQEMIRAGVSGALGDRARDTQGRFV